MTCCACCPEPRHLFMLASSVPAAAFVKSPLKHSTAHSYIRFCADVHGNEMQELERLRLSGVADTVLLLTNNQEPQLRLIQVTHIRRQRS